MNFSFSALFFFVLTHKSFREMDEVTALDLVMLDNKPSNDTKCLLKVIHREAATVEQGYTKVMLRGVPRFLIDAFDRILKEKTMGGLFRKEGNAA
ncbi:hypothetical protein PRIPAC_77495 [Pristionchus pacificus]|uniref:Uncharacterized protein n=1 Tax=Pristionchus pacificus TaxID=54126 RepID=A0A2A6C3N5_PRIPA|nr:hypothetical protein PRIPAC_77495 [Pristionchus pacificus]|eukprot:PDM72653.1 hypothetical protein PRIPAC_39087 [Pristionchus pacificus]